MTNHTEVISASNLDSKVADINAASGTVVQIVQHPYMTDGVGPMIIVLWSTP